MKPTTINQALKCFGGFVRYYDTTEDLRRLAALVAGQRCGDVLACCAGGNQALTLLGAAGKVSTLWAVDINPAQLFVLAVKADFLRRQKVLPSFKQMHDLYPDRIAAVRKNMRRLKEVYLCHAATGKRFIPPAVLAEQYALVADDEMFVSDRPGTFWQKDPLFKAQVCARLKALRFIHMDIFDSAGHFAPRSFDLIYLSDIFWPQVLPYYQNKLIRLAGLLKRGGRIIACLDQGDDYLGKGISPAGLLLQQAAALSLKPSQADKGDYLVLEKTGGKG